MYHLRDCSLQKQLYIGEKGRERERERERERDRERDRDRDRERQRDRERERERENDCEGMYYNLNIMPYRPNPCYCILELAWFLS